MRYCGLVDQIRADGAEELNKRTGMRVKRLFAREVGLEHDEGIFLPRAVYPKISAAEAVWMLGGAKSTVWLNQQTSIWKKFEDSPGVIETAYGNRWRSAFGRDQIKEAVELLKADPSSRQALVVSWDPRVDGLANQGKTKNVPCPFAFNLYILDGVGRIVVYQRSCDVMAGLPYDLMTYYIVGQAMFNSVGVGFCGVSILIGDAHIYEDHYAAAAEMGKATRPDRKHMLEHCWTVEEIMFNRDVFVAAYADLYADVDFPMVNKLKVAQ